jgi:hypothetical protein
VGLNSLKSLNLTNVYPNKNNKNKNKNNKNNKVKSKPLELRSRVKISIFLVFMKLKILGGGGLAKIVDTIFNAQFFSKKNIYILLLNRRCPKSQQVQSVECRT